MKVDQGDEGSLMDERCGSNVSHACLLAEFFTHFDPKTWRIPPYG